MNPQQEASVRGLQRDIERLKTLGKKSFSDFVKLNTGRVGSKNALAIGSLVGGSVLMELFLSGVAHATYGCDHSQWQDASSYCYHSCTKTPIGTPIESPCASDGNGGCFSQHPSPHSGGCP